MVPLLSLTSFSGTFTRLRGDSTWVAVELGYVHMAKQDNLCGNRCLRRQAPSLPVPQD